MRACSAAACAELELLVQIRRFGARAVELARQARGVGDRGIEEAAALGEVLFGRRAGARLLAHFGFGFEPLRVDVGVRLDGGVEIAVERLGPLGFLLELVPQRLGLAPGLRRASPTAARSRRAAR